MPKTNLKPTDKFLAGFFILFTSFYFATAVHEIGHAIAYLSYGCQRVNMWVSPLIVGFTKCYQPNPYYFNSVNQELIINSAGIAFVSLVGLILLLAYQWLRRHRQTHDRVIMILLTYFFAFAFLLNGFAQLLLSSDIRKITATINKQTTNAIAVIIGLILAYHLWQFPQMIRLVEPKVTNKTVKIISLMFYGLVGLILFGYFLYKPILIKLY